jgi:hypothetical protein
MEVWFGKKGRDTDMLYALLGRANEKDSLSMVVHIWISLCSPGRPQTLHPPACLSSAGTTGMNQIVVPTCGVYPQSQLLRRLRQEQSLEPKSSRSA